MKPKWSYRKADWAKFREVSESKVSEVDVSKGLDHAVRTFNKCILETAMEIIPRGKRRTPLPWWTPEVDEAVKKRRDCAGAAGQGEEAKQAWIEASQEASKAIKEERAKSRKDFTSKDLTDHTSTTKVWTALKSLDGKLPRKELGQAIIVNGKTISHNKDKARAFAKEYAAVSRLPRDKEQDR